MLSGNHFPPDPRVWQPQNIKFSGKWNQFDLYFTPLTRKWFYTFILPSNHFRVMRKRERARERRELSHQNSHRSNSLWVTPSSPHLRSFTVVRSLSQTQTHSREAPCRSWLRKAPRRPQSCLHADHDLAKHRADRSPSSNLIASLSSFFSQFDQIWWFFFFGFCLCFYIKE